MNSTASTRLSTRLSTPLSSSRFPCARPRRTLAAWGALVVLTVGGSALADVPISENASRHFKEGVRYLTTHDAGRFEKAYAQFRSAYADSPSWKVLGNLGIVAEALERDGEAIDAYRGYVEGGAKTLSASERQQFNSDQSRLELGSASVELRATPDGAWIIDERLPEEGKPILNRYGPSSGGMTLRLRAGHHRLHAELNGRSSESWEFEALPGGTGSHEFDLRPPEPRPPTAHPEPVEERSNDTHDTSSLGGNPTGKIAGYASLGFGTVGAGLGAYFFVRSLDRREEGDRAYEQCSNKSLPESTQRAGCLLSDEKTHEETRERVRSGVSFGVAGALVATGVLLLVYSGDSSGSASDAAALTPWVGLQQFGISGRF